MMEEDDYYPKTIPNVIVEAMLYLILHWIQASAWVVDVNVSTYEQIHRLEPGAVLLISESRIVPKIPK